MTFARSACFGAWTAAAVVAAGLSVGLCGDALAQESTPAQPQQSTPAQGEQAKPNFTWIRRCLVRGDVTFCEVSYGVMMDVGNNAKRWIARAGIQEEPGTKNRDLFLFTPLGVRLTQGVAFRIDDNTPQKATFSLCLDVGCQAIAKGDDKLLAELKAGKELQIQSILADGRSATLSVSLSGFTKAYDGPPQETLKATPTLPTAQAPSPAPAAAAKGDAPAN